MTITSLRQFVKRHGILGPLLASVYVSARPLWTRKPVTLLVCMAALLTGATAWDAYHPRSVSYEGYRHRSYRLYVGRVRASAPQAAPPLDRQLLEYWAEDGRTNEVRKLTRDFARSVGRQDRVRAVGLGNRLCSLFQHPRYDLWNKDGKWLLHAAVGEIYLKQGWLGEAEQEFQSVLSAVPAAKPYWGRSSARQMVAYGLARLNALSNSYRSALQRLAQAPGEYNNGCGNCIEWKEAKDHPLKVVWSAAGKPLPTAEAELLKIMSGRFTPMKTELNADSSEEQKQCAAAEAGLALGCLYEQAGRRAEAEDCWHLVAAKASAQLEAAYFAGRMPGRLRHNHVPELLVSR